MSDEARATQPVRRDTLARRLTRMTLLLIVGLPLAWILFMTGCQRKMIYYARQYQPTYHLGLPVGALELEYETRAGRQVSFYIPPRDGTEGPPRQLWIIFGGNATIALDWLDFLAAYPDEGTGFLLFEYPGYGHSEGRPSRGRIAQASDAAVEALARHFGVGVDEIAPDIGLWGVSLGAAVALEHAQRHPTHRVLLVSPFTSMVEMAKGMFGWPLCHLVFDRFDNRDRLAELATMTERPTLTLFHGDADQIVPVRNGRELAAAHPDWIEYIEVRGGDHNLLIAMARDEILEVMLRPLTRESDSAPE